jgi:hypothetical protein
VEGGALRLGIMQPYFFPYLGYFSLIANTDSWVVFDVTQYTPKSWINRNRVLHPERGWMYVTVPLHGSTRNMAIHDARVLSVADSHRSVLGKLSHYRHRAPHFARVCDLVEQTFASTADDSLVHLNVRALESVCSYLDIPFRYRLGSEMNLPAGRVTHAGGWAPLIAESLGADEYLNPIGGMDLFDRDEFAGAGVALAFLETPAFVYPTPGFEFEPGLSILDVLLWNRPDAVLEAIGTAHISQGG